MSPKAHPPGPALSPALQHGVYVRVSVTDRCNLRCQYCRGANGVEAPEEADKLELAPAALAGLVEVIDGVIPVRKVRITGGEPLLRSDIVDVVRALGRAVPSATLAITTNGVRLAPVAAELRSAGLGAVNVSLDATSAEVYSRLTGGGSLDAVVAGLEAARDAGIETRKVNAVLLASANADGLADIVRLASSYGAEPRFIELMPNGPAATRVEEDFLSADQALASLSEAFTFLGPLGRVGAAERYGFDDDGRALVVGMIAAVSRPFCEECDRLRIDSSGSLLACLRRPGGLDLAGPLERGDLDEVRRLVLEAIGAKCPPVEGWSNRSMSAIGG